MIDHSDLLPEEKPRLPPPTSDAFSWRRVITQLRHASVRDLAFLLLSPPLLHPGHPRWHGKVQEFTEEELRIWRRWLLIQDMVPEGLERFLAQENASGGDSAQPASSAQRLGRYAEQLLAFALSNAPTELGIQLIARNVQLVNAGARTTSGELDFVIERHGAVEHWELAVKFYISTGTASLDDFVSPASLRSGAQESRTIHQLDSLGTKLGHLFEKQLALEKLLDQSQAPEFNVPAPITVSRAYLRGWLFYPAYARGLSSSSVPFDWGLHPQHPHGIWLKNEDGPTLNAGSWLELPRLGWLSPAKVARNKATREYPTAVLKPATDATVSHPSLWAQMRKHDDGTRQELQRVFVVPTVSTP